MPSLRSFPATTTARRGRPEWSGIPEVGSQGPHTPPHSPPLSAANKSRTPSPTSPRSGSSLAISSGRRGAGAAYTVTEECERLFCETLRAVFSGERERRRDELVTGARYSDADTGIGRQQYAVDGGHDKRRVVVAGLGTPPPDVSSRRYGAGFGTYVSQWVEIWDYQGGATFRGFLADGPGPDDRALFIFFDGSVVGKDLKQGLMALIELASMPSFACTELVVCLERATEESIPSKNLLRDLRWVGFELATMAKWTSTPAEVVSDRWLFMSMDTS